MCTKESIDAFIANEDFENIFDEKKSCLFKRQIFDDIIVAELKKIK